LSTLADKLDSTYSQVYALQLNERLSTIALDTGLSVKEVKRRVREYRERR